MRNVARGGADEIGHFLHASAAARPFSRDLRGLSCQRNLASNSRNITPGNPHSTSGIVVELSAIWPNSCVPKLSDVRVVDNDIFVDVIWDYPCGIACLTVISSWSFEHTVGALAEGAWSAHGRLVADVNCEAGYRLLEEFVVTDSQFVVSRQSVGASENDTAEFSVSLLNPAGEVDVTVDVESGDADSAVQSGRIGSWRQERLSVQHHPRR